MRAAADTLAARFSKKYVSPFRIAELYGLAADRDDSLLWLRKSLAMHDLSAAFLRQPTWDFLRSDPAFQEIFQKRMQPQP